MSRTSTPTTTATAPPQSEAAGADFDTSPPAACAEARNGRASERSSGAIQANRAVLMAFLLSWSECGARVSRVDAAALGGRASAGRTWFGWRPRREEVVQGPESGASSPFLSGFEP